MVLISAKRSFEVGIKQCPFRLRRSSGRDDPFDACVMRARNIQRRPAAEEAHAYLAHFVVLQPFINRNEHGIIKNFYSLCEADAVLADALLVSGVIPAELPDLLF